MALRRVIPEKIQQLPRLIHYYELKFESHPDFINRGQTPFMCTINKMAEMAAQFDTNRYLKINDKSIFVQDLVVHPATREVSGKISSVDKEVFPEILNTENDTRRGIEALEQEGVVETSHFIIKYGAVIRIALEYNRQGAKINDLCNYLQRIGSNHEFIVSAIWIPIVRSDMQAMLDSMNRCSEILVKVHRDRIQEIESIDEGIFSAMRIATEEFGNDYATLTLNYDYRKSPATPEATSLLTKLVRAFIGNPEKMTIFDTIEVRAENRNKNNKMEAYDLLVDKVKSRIFVQKTAKHRTVISSDIYDKIRAELHTLNI
jgi:hypothetical protein